ncbi:Mucin-associated surface protein (MASP) [Trypanosoma cruzi]|uniref:Mucin-associated surface protein (MASP), putative n=2 Tax=Trypanosoma cruzi TaxID=5693 RepID=Q4DUZ3_TRYCC|nr:mucin-associated surface protein (MASP), putative [Trypanosoma cruzi]EAN96333.1 mucin-associated surface protein (MASP), putative [Trypanosoma cruzi]PWV19917.1 Mucin-associated surface protein (MASP) [Trypanosoma cruzi]|eukprot:XP_818184.1 mucin-associated surface protein (MASP) [Trypanosoma cruzi strain CL Brener]
MAMMTGRVLLVCALFVLWCAAGGGGRCDGGETAGLGSAEHLPESEAPEKSPEGTQGIRDGTGGVKGQVPSKPPEDEVEEDEDEDDEDEEEDSEENGDGAGAEYEEGKRTEGQGDQEVTVTSYPNSGEKNSRGNEQQTRQSIVSAGDIPHSGSQESNANPTQTKIEKKKETDENTPAVESPLKTVNREQTLPAGIAGGNPSPAQEEGIDSREQDGEDTTSEDKKNVPPPDTAATPQSHREEGSEGTEEDTKATTVTANTTDTTNTQNNDSSTAVSHTTSPPLLLIVVACAAAAAVVAA